MKTITDQFSELFRGYELGHGQHELFDKPDESGKIKGRASTKATGATAKEYEVHLKGAGTSLGLIPLLKDDTCWFGAIDVDIQGQVKLNETIEQLEKRIRDLELPIVVCRSKSGGAHLYVFGAEPLPAKVLIRKLTEFAAALGYGGCEIFPKQSMRADLGDRGNWINIAYYGTLGKSGTDRYAIRNGKPIKKIEEFLGYANQMRIRASELDSVAVKMSDLFSDGPPCLQHFATFGLQSGGRNTALTNVAVYYKKAKPDSWQEATMEFNFQHFQPPLDVQEVNQVLKNVARKDYFYTCKQPPLVNHCDKKTCVKREFGITFGKDEGELFPIDNLTKCVSRDSVRWYAETQSLRMEVTTEQLFSPVLMQKVCAEKLHVVIIPGKNRDWHLRLKELFETCTIIDDPVDASRNGQFENLLDNFFTASRPARNKDEIIKGNAYLEDHRIHFRSEDLFNYLTIRRFQHTPHEIWLWLKTMGAKAEQVKIKGKTVRVWTLPEPEKYDNSPLSLPNTEEEL
jgi:hypothetical protein